MAGVIDPQDRRQDAVVAFTSFAWQASSVSATIVRSVDVLIDVLAVPSGALLQLTTADTALVVHAAGRLSRTVGNSLPVDVARAVAPVTQVPGPDRPHVGPSTTAPRPDCSAHGPVLSVLVTVEGLPWGRLVVNGHPEQQFTREDADLARMVAAVLGAALEREQVDDSRAVLSDFGRFALAARDTAGTIERAIAVVRQLLPAPDAAVIRPSADRANALVLVQAAGPWGAAAGLEYDVDPRLAQAVAASDVLVIADCRDEPRFSTRLVPARVANRPPVAFLAVPILIDGRVWGRLVAADSEPHRFDDREVELARSVAAVLARAVERRYQEWTRLGAALVPLAREPQGEPAPGGPYPASMTQVALLDRDGVIVWVNQAWRDFALSNGGDPERTGVGVSYLGVCARAQDPATSQVRLALQAAVHGDLPAPMTVVIPCHSPTTTRWFDVLISSRMDDAGACIGATVTLSPAQE